jgi:hypothetical protein
VGKPVITAGTPELDAQALLKTIMPAAQASLEEREGFVPIAALVALDGTVRVVSRGLQEMPTKESVDMLREQLRNEVKDGAVRSAALAADVMIWRSKDGDEASNAVSIHVEHQNGYCVDLLVPYKVRKGMMSRLRRKPQVMFRKMIAQESEAVIFLPSGLQGQN